MKRIEADDADGIMLELETWTRATANEERFAAAVVIVMREDGSAYFSHATSDFDPDTRLQLGGMLMHLGRHMATQAEKEGGTLPEEPKPKRGPRLVGVS